MSAQIFLDKFSALTPRQKVVRVGIVVLVILLSYVLVFWWGTRKAREWADSKYLQERQERLAEIDSLKKSADESAARSKELTAVNDQLRAQNEATAEILKANDAKIAGDAKKFVDLQKQRETQSNEIQNATDADTARALCDDARRSGFTLSFCR